MSFSEFCPDCGVLVGQQHKPECAVERCSGCNAQRATCGCDSHDPAKSVWTGEWPLPEQKQSSPSIQQIAYREGRSLLDRYGLSDWAIVVSRIPRPNSEGSCHIEEKTIYISPKFLEKNPTLDDLRDLILHEIAHALTNGGHNLGWKRKYAELLYDHFTPMQVWQYLYNCRYCCSMADQLKASVEKPTNSKVTFKLECLVCGEARMDESSDGMSFGNGVSDTYLLVVFDCGHQHTLRVRSGSKHPASITLMHGNQLPKSGKKK